MQDDSKMTPKKTCLPRENVRGATQNFREFEYTVQTVSATNFRR